MLSGLLSTQFLSWAAFQALRPKVQAMLVLWSGEGSAEMVAARALAERLLAVKDESEWVQLIDFGMKQLVEHVVTPMTKWEKPK